MKLQTRFMLSFSIGIAGVLLISEVLRQSYESGQMAQIKNTYPERLEAATRENLAPMAHAVERLREAMAEGDMDAFQRVLNRQRGSDGILGATLFDAKGKAVFTSESSEDRGRLAPGILDALLTTGKPQDRRAGNAIEMYQPFVIGTSCLQCHSERKLGEVAGVLGVRMSNASFVRVQESWLDAMSAMRRATLWVGVGASAILVLALVLLVGALVRRQLTRPLAATTSFVETISHGDLSADISAELRGRSDEIGTLATAMNAMVTRLRDLLHNVLVGARTTATASSALSKVASRTAERVRDVLARSDTAERSATTSSEDAVTAAAGIGQASTNLSAVANLTQEVQTKVSDTAVLFEQARTATEQASGDAQSISASMKGLTNAAEDIGKVADAISSISEQTNLLALNATIEAARAGTMGKGFAVVASEIKNLAQETSLATNDVKTKTGTVQASTSTAIADLARVAKAIREIHAMVSGTATALAEEDRVIRDVAERIAQASLGVEDANQGVGRAAEAMRSIAVEIAAVNEAMGDIRSGGDAVQASAQELSRLARELTAAADAFKLPPARAADVAPLRLG